MLPSDNRRQRYRLHKIIYAAVLASFFLFLVLKYFNSQNSILSYTVFGYILLVVPISKRLNVTLHAVISSIALVLVGLVSFLNLI